LQPRLQTVTPTAVIQPKPGIGDVLWHLPFIRAIAAAAPGGQVTFLAPPTSRARDLLAAEPGVAATLYYQHHGNELQRGLNLLRLILLLRKNRFRTLWILDRTIRPALAGLLAGIPERIGLGLGPQSFFITNAGIDRRHLHDHTIEWFVTLMAANNLPLNPVEPNLRLPTEAVAAVQSKFASLPRPWLSLGFASTVAPREWSAEQCTSFIELVGKYGGTVFLNGGPADAARADALISRTRTPSVINTCLLPILESAALLQRCDVYVGPDSGPLNIAAAVGIPAFGLFGVTPPLTYSRFIHAVTPEAGSPGGIDAMRFITPKQVFARIESYLAKKS
jgi:heptosyltransferase-2